MKRGLTAGLAVAVLVAAAAGGLYYTSAAKAAARRSALVEEATLAMAAPEPDRGELLRLDRELADLAREDPADQLILARAGVLIAADLVDRAWEVLEPVLLLRRDGPEHWRLAARILVRRSALTGDADAARRGADFARRCDAAVPGGDAAMALMAWQASVRVEDGAVADAMAERLRQAHADTWPAQVVDALHAFDPTTAGPADARRLQDLMLEGRGTPELLVAIATVELASDDPATQVTGMGRVQQALAEVPSWKDARIVAVYGCTRLGDAATRDAHLRWLLDNHPRDPRAPTWRQMLGS